MPLGKPLARQEDPRRLRHRLQRQLKVRLIRGIVGTMRVLLRVVVRRVLEVGEALWCTTRRAWVRPRQQREARPVRRVRRLAGKRCEVARVRLTQPRLQAWPLVRLW